MTPVDDLDALLPSAETRRVRRDALLAELSRPEPVSHRTGWARTFFRRGLPTVLVSGALVGVGLGGTTVVVGDSGVPAVDVVAAARAATVPAEGEILHVRMRMQLLTPVGGQSGPSHGPDGDPIPTFTGRIESWRATSPLRTRTRWFVTLPDRPGVHHHDASYADGVRRESASWRAGVRTTELGADERGRYEQEWAEDGGSWLQRTTGSADPVLVMRDLLDGGQLRDAGRAELDGRALRRLIGEQSAVGAGPNDPTAYEYLVDAETFAPVRITATRRVPAQPDAREPRTLVDRWTFERFERLPLTAENAERLTVTAP